MGQIGSELVPALRAVYGGAAVLATDLRAAEDAAGTGERPSEVLDCLDAAALADAVRRHRARTIYHLAALLSARAEADPARAYTVNMGTLLNVLEVARDAGCAVFVPSSIAAFGPDGPRDPAPQDGAQRPTTMYGVTKVAGELLCDYYHARYGVDTRGVRYPGIISYSAEPGGGTTDYAVEMFVHAASGRRYSCYLEADTQLDMMYMPDAVRAAMELMAADASRLRHRNAFNIAAMQFTPAELAAQIRRRVPEFEVEYRVDPVRQRIADSWPRRLDDAAARAEWGWSPRYDLDAMADDMLRHLGAARTQPAESAGEANG